MQHPFCLQKVEYTRVLTAQDWYRNNETREVKLNIGNCSKVIYLVKYWKPNSVSIFIIITSLLVSGVLSCHKKRITTR